MIPFRKKALAEISAPEQLDKLLRVVSPFSWLALSGLVALAVSLLIWGIYGSIATRVSGKGIFLTYGTALVDAASEYGGRVIAVNTAIGIKVHKNDLLVKIVRTDLNQVITNLERNLEVLRQEKDAREKRINNAAEIRGNYVKKQEETLNYLIAAKEKDLAYIESTLVNKEKMVKLGYLAKDSLEKVRQDKRNILQEVSASKSELVSLYNSIQERKDQMSFDLDEAVRNYNNKAAELEKAKMERSVSESVVSPVDGTITNVQAQLGDRINAGQPLVSILQTGTGLRVLSFFSAEGGRQIKANMRALIEPAGIKKEEYGSIIGNVSHVADFPISLERMKTLLRNEDLAKRLSVATSLLEVQIALKFDNNKLKWTSKRTNELQINPGTLCNINITVREQPPITLVIPALKKILGVVE